MPEPWKSLLIDDDASIRAVLHSAKRIAVLGIKTEAQSEQPAFYVAKSAQDAGYEVIPVPVYYPEATQILGQPVYRSVAAVPGPIDIVDVFRKPSDVPAHVEDILAAKPKVVWMQTGIRHDAAAERLARAGIKVVQARCLMVEIRRHGRG
jgi:predicted CoA-binding protein